MPEMNEFTASEPLKEVQKGCQGHVPELQEFTATEPLKEVQKGY